MAKTKTKKKAARKAPVAKKGKEKKKVTSKKVVKKVAPKKSTGITSKVKQVTKRGDKVVPFVPEKITKAVFKAFQATGEGSMTDAKKVSTKVVQLLNKNYKEGRIPEIEELQDLVERVVEINGGNVNYEDADIQSTIFGSIEFGSQTAQQSTAIGSDPGVLSSFRLAFKLADRNGRRMWIIIRKVQFGAEGNIFGKSGDGYSMANFKGTVLADTFYPENADMIQIIRID